MRRVVPLLVRRVSEWQMLVLAMLSTGATYLVFPLVHGMPLLLTLAFILGFGLGGAQPMIMSLLCSKAPAGRAAEAIGVRSLIINLSQTGMPLLFGALGEALGMTPVFWAMAVCLIVSGYFARKRLVSCPRSSLTNSRAAVPPLCRLAPRREPPSLAPGRPPKNGGLRAGAGWAAGAQRPRRGTAALTYAANLGDRTLAPPLYAASLCRGERGAALPLSTYTATLSSMSTSAR